MYGYLLLLLATIYAKSGESANVLVIIPFTSKSHYILLRPIGLELARRGHNVTIITSNKETNPPPNYHEVLVEEIEIWDFVGGKRPNVFTFAGTSAENFQNIVLWEGGYGFAEFALNSTNVKHFLNQDNSFDLVVSEDFNHESFYVLAHKYRAPLVLVTTVRNCMTHKFLTGNPLQLYTAVQEYLDIKDLNVLWNKIRNTYFTMYAYIWWKYWYLEKQEQLVKKYFAKYLSETPPNLYEIQKNASLFMINRHFSFDPPTALLPNIVEIGGIHLTQSNLSLPNDLRSILDDSKNGFIYMNFGSNIRSSELPIEKKMAFVNVFRKLKETVLWKWEDDHFENESPNIVTRKWLPQKEILAHPNIKVFIAHCGLIGLQEAIFNGVPIVGIPIYGDQYNNMLQVEQSGFGRMLEYQNIDENELENILFDVLNNDSYKNKAKEVSQRFKDRPMTPLETAMFWLEYVMRHRGAHFMKNPARELSWFEYMMLDVFFAVLVVILAFGILAFMALKLLQKMFKNRVKIKTT